jgi:2-keto-4-pentenoate hydratase
MDTSVRRPDVSSIANEVLASFGTHCQIQPFSSRHDGLTLDDAYRVTPLLRAAFEKRGEKILGRKIGFTNRTMWPKYGVYAPIWGYVTDATTQNMTKTSTSRAADFAEPMLEPEIIFGLKAAPAPDMDENALLDCIDWLSLGYEIVQTIFPGWKFEPADTVATNALHGALYIGERHAVTPRKTEWLRELASFEVNLSCGYKSLQGRGANVLDSPLSALRHLVSMLAKDPYNPPLAAGEIISTGVITLPVLITAGEHWTTKASGIPLGEISLRIE